MVRSRVTAIVALIGSALLSCHGLDLSGSVDAQRAAARGVDELCEEGVRLFTSGNTAGSLETFLRAEALAADAASDSKVPEQKVLRTARAKAQLGLAAAQLKSGDFAAAEATCSDVLVKGCLSKEARSQALLRRGKAHRKLGNALDAMRDAHYAIKAAPSPRAQKLLDELSSECPELCDEELELADKEEAVRRGFCAPEAPKMPLDALTSGPLGGGLGSLLGSASGGAGGAGGAPSIASLLPGMLGGGGAGGGSGMKEKLMALAKRVGKNLEDEEKVKKACAVIKKQDPKAWSARIKALGGDEGTGTAVEGALTRLKGAAEPATVRKLVKIYKRGDRVRRALKPVYRLLKLAAPLFPVYVAYLWIKWTLGSRKALFESAAAAGAAGAAAAGAAGAAAAGAAAAASGAGPWGVPKGAGGAAPDAKNAAADAAAADAPGAKRAVEV